MMPNSSRAYIAIDLKSFYASVECVDRGLDPLSTNLVVADESRTEKTICLAVSPSMKAYGLSGRARLFEVVQRIHEVNAQRKQNIAGHSFSGKSWLDTEIKAHPDWEVDYIRATPRMAFYIEYSTRIYQIYLKYIAPEDIHVYSIDEVFMDVTNYLASYKMTAHELARTMIQDVLRNTGITATAGIGTNLYLAKIAMDIVAKHIPADADGVRIAELDEMSYRRQLWDYRPLTRFWRVGHGIADKLAPHGIDTMGKIARCSIDNEELLYRLFGVNAELLIDHAWGWEPCTIDMVKRYRPHTTSISSGQVLTEPYDKIRACTVIKEMADRMALELLDKHAVTNQLVMTVGYDVENLATPNISTRYDGAIVTDYYGRRVPKHANGSIRLETATSSSKALIVAATELFERIVNPILLIRRLHLTANNVVDETKAECPQPVQLDLFTDYEKLKEHKAQEKAALSKERRLQKTILELKKQFGKNAILRGLNYKDGATAIQRNGQIGGHKA